MIDVLPLDGRTQNVLGARSEVAAVKVSEDFCRTNVLRRIRAVAGIDGLLAFE